MKVIEHGKLPEARVYRARCVYCRCLVEFTEGEARQMTDRNETYLIVRCPDCKRDIYANEHAIKDDPR